MVEVSVVEVSVVEVSVSGSLSTYACTTTWAFVPPKPNADTPARASRLGQGVGSVTTRSVSQGMCGLGRWKCRLGGIRPWCRARTVLMRPAIPAAASRWPRFVFAEPSSTGVRTAAAMARASIGSPRYVPVPWASM